MKSTTCMINCLHFVRCTTNGLDNVILT